jgi:hypothetical protein
MARIRTIKPEFFTSDDVCAMSPLARLLFIGCWCEADREGRFEWRPRTLKRKYLPEDDCDADEVCGELISRGLIVLYDQGLAYVTGFTKHQVINLREAQSKYPEPPAVTCNAHASPAIAPGKGKEGKGKEGKKQPNGCLPAEGGKTRRKSTLPDDWSPTAEQLDYARAQGCSDPSDTATRFKLHHIAKGTLGLNWHAAFQYWCRNEKNFQRAPRYADRREAAANTVASADELLWEARFRNYQPGGMWQEATWGPRPESGRCHAPQPVVERWRGRVAQ